MKSTNPSKRKQTLKQTVNDAENRSNTPDQSDNQNGSEVNDQGKGRRAEVGNRRGIVERATEGLVRLELQRRRRALLRWFLAICVVLGIGYAIHTALSSWLGMDPITHVWELIRVRLPLGPPASR
ncbi:hypothetical protein SH528x_000245 [Novipirellula sp. SH528]|uniref:hypothetical protein n=1 Tax=Novipirellula sp. SH528 TaxID=3454466 RepID=UPI003FA00089